MANDEKFHVSGWEDDLNDIDEERNPHGKQMITVTTKILRKYLQKPLKKKCCGLQKMAI